MGPEIIATPFEGKRKVTKKRQRFQRQSARKFLVTLRKNQQRFYPVRKSRSRKTTGFRKISAIFTGGTRSAWSSVLAGNGCHKEVMEVGSPGQSQGGCEWIGLWKGGGRG